MKVLFIGGTGNISTACVDRALAKGMDVTLVTRGQRPSPWGDRVTMLRADRHDLSALSAIARTTHYDVVCDFVGFVPEDVETDIAAFSGYVGQYIYISSASAYQKPVGYYMITESTPLANPFWQYSRNKIACEERLMRAYREESFPITIVRPSYTYGKTWVPCGIGGHGYTVVDRMRRGAPIISHGDGQSLWVMTSNLDFAVGFVGLFGKSQAIGEAFHITSDEVLTWDEIYRTIGRAAGVTPDIVHISSDFIATVEPSWGPGLWGDKAHSVAFDNSKIKRVVPEYLATTSFYEGMVRSMAWLDADPARQGIDQETNAIMDRIIALYRQALAAI